MLSEGSVRILKIFYESTERADQNREKWPSILDTCSRHFEYYIFISYRFRAKFRLMSGKRGSKPTEYVVNILEVRACFVLLVVLNRLFILVYAILYLDLHLFSWPRWPIISDKVVPSNYQKYWFSTIQLLWQSFQGSSYGTLMSTVESAKNQITLVIEKQSISPYLTQNLLYSSPISCQIACFSLIFLAARTWVDTQLLTTILINAPFHINTNNCFGPYTIHKHITIFKFRIDNMQVIIILMRRCYSS